MHVDPTNSIRRLGTAMPFLNATGQSGSRKHDSKGTSEPDDVELQLSDEVESVPKHQQTKSDGQTGTDSGSQQPPRPDDNHLDVTV